MGKNTVFFKHRRHLELDPIAAESQLMQAMRKINHQYLKYIDFGIDSFSEKPFVTLYFKKDDYNFITETIEKSGVKSPPISGSAEFLNKAPWSAQKLCSRTYSDIEGDNNAARTIEFLVANKWIPDANSELLAKIKEFGAAIIVPRVELGSPS